MPKPVIHVGIGLTLNPYTRGEEIISLSAAVKEDVFRVNLVEAQPPPMEGLTKYWEKNQEAWREVRANCLPRKQGLQSYIDWISRYPGRHVAVCSALDFYALWKTLMGTFGKCSFGTAGHLDWKTFVGTRNGDYGFANTSAYKESPLPWEQALARGNLMGGVVKRSIAPKGRPDYQIVGIEPLAVNENFIVPLPWVGNAAQMQARLWRAGAPAIPDDPEVGFFNDVAVIEGLRDAGEEEEPF